MICFINTFARFIRDNIFDEWKLFTCSSETYYRDSGIHTNHTGGLDLVFVFDGSNSVSGKEFKKGLNFAVTLVDMLGATWK